MRNTGWLRVLFVLVLGQALLLGQAMVWPATHRRDAAVAGHAAQRPLRRRALLHGRGHGAAGDLRRELRRGARLLVLVVVITGGLLVLTLPHLGEFTASTFPYRWVAFYTVDAVVIGVVLWRLRGREPVPAGRNPVGHARAGGVRARAGGGRGRHVGRARRSRSDSGRGA